MKMTCSSVETQVGLSTEVCATIIYWSSGTQQYLLQLSVHLELFS